MNTSAAEKYHYPMPPGGYEDVPEGLRGDHLSAIVFFTTVRAWDKQDEALGVEFDYGEDDEPLYIEDAFDKIEVGKAPTFGPTFWIMRTQRNPMEDGTELSDLMWIEDAAKSRPMPYSDEEGFHFVCGGPFQSEQDALDGMNQN